MTVSVLPSPQTTFAIILGVSECPQAPALTASDAFTNSAWALHSYLVSSSFGLPESHVLDRFDSNQPAAQLLTDIAAWLNQQQGMRDLIVYYTGHGGFARGDRAYFLAGRQTRQGMEGATSIRMMDLAQLFRNETPFVRRYLILDCCFAGEAAKAGFMGTPLQIACQQTQEVLPSRGTALLCSSSAADPSIAPPGERYTMFSGALLMALQRGIGDGSPALSLGQIGDQVWTYIRERYLDQAVRPELHSPDQREGDVATVPLFPNLVGRATLPVADVRSDHLDRLGTAIGGHSVLLSKPGYMTGHIADERGKPLSGVEVHVFGYSNAGQKVYFTAVSDARGDYSQRLPDGFYGAHAFLPCRYHGAEYHFPLHPLDGQDDANADSLPGIIKDFSWKISGPKPGRSLNPEDDGTYYGGRVIVGDPMKYDMEVRHQHGVSHAKIAGGPIEIMLTPDGPLIDGGEGRGLSYRLDYPARYSTIGCLGDVPIGRYTVTAKIPGRFGLTRSLRVAVDNNNGQDKSTIRPSSSALLQFPPFSPGARLGIYLAAVREVTLYVLP